MNNLASRDLDLERSLVVRGNVELEVFLEDRDIAVMLVTETFLKQET